MKNTATLAASLALALTAASSFGASVNFSGVYVQTFNSLPSSGFFADAATAAVMPVPTSAVDYPAGSYASLAGWSFFDTIASSQRFRVDNGGSNTGATFSYGSTGDVDRALGSVASGTETPMFGVELKNTTGSTINDININFYAEQWRRANKTSSGAANDAPVHVLSFSHKFDAPLNDAGFTAVSALDAPVTKPNRDSTTAEILNGNLAENRTYVNFSLSNLNWAPDSVLVLRWADFNDLGNDHAIAIDDLRVTAIPVPAALPLGLAGIALAAALRRRMAR